MNSPRQDTSPRVDVLNAFIGGGAQVGDSFITLATHELQNYATVTHNAHTLRFGVRVRTAKLDILRQSTSAEVTHLRAGWLQNWMPITN
jgi:hypothetical protein